MRVRALWVVALLCAAGPAQAVSAILHFDGTVFSAYGPGAPSLTALGLTYGSPLHYEVKIDTEALAYQRQDGWLYWILPTSNAPDFPEEHTEPYYAELIAQAYPTPGSWFGRDQQIYAGFDGYDPDAECPLEGDLRVGTAFFGIRACDSVTDWPVGKEVSSYHFWHDPDTDALVSVYGQLTLTDIVPVPEPDATAMLVSGATLLACLHRRRRRA